MAELSQQAKDAIRDAMVYRHGQIYLSIEMGECQEASDFCTEHYGRTKPSGYMSEEAHWDIDDDPSALVESGVITQEEWDEWEKRENEG